MNMFVGRCNLADTTHALKALNRWRNRQTHTNESNTFGRWDLATFNISKASRKTSSPYLVFLLGHLAFRRYVENIS